AAELVAPPLLSAIHASDGGWADLLLPGRASTPEQAYLARWEGLVPRVTFVLLTGALLFGLVWSFRPDRSSSESLSTKAVDPGIGGFALLGAWFGLLCGLGEAWFLGGRVFALGLVAPDFRGVSQDSLWMAPVTDMALFAGLAVTVAIGARALGRRLSLRAAVGLFAGLTLFIWIGQTGRAWTWAAALLAAGVGARFASTFVPSRRILNAACGIGAVGIAFVVVALAFTTRDRRLPDAVRTPAGGSGTTERPSVILIVLDTQRAESTGLYGSPRRTTPNLDRWAAEGIVFERAISPSSWTLPSHATMFTGLPNRELGTGVFTPLSPRYLTIAEFLRGEGYRTGAFVANLGFCSDFYGLDQGFEIYLDQPRSLTMLLTSAWLPRWLAGRLYASRGLPPDQIARKRAPEVSEEFLAWWDRVGGEPYFAFLNYFDAHAPYAPPGSFATAFADELPYQWYGGDPEEGPRTPEEVAALETAYDSGIRYLDHHVGRLLDGLESRSALENTWVIVTSDHGESFGEHGQLGHMKSLYMTEIHVPLVIIPPKPLRGSTPWVETPVGLADLPATIAALVGKSEAFPGTTLLDPRSGRPVRSELQGAGGWRSIVADSLHYLRRPDGSEELYHLDRDPEERHDLAGASGPGGALERLRAAVRAGTRR
ncbi:MAG: sulfatase, partial [Gemmatimonadota bacterium]|nr:sulfatase [Gemmatimonadota bacterium]